METNRLRHNEAVKETTEQQLLLNIVRLRYTDTPSSLSVASIADQHEIVSGLRAIPFFTADAGGKSFGGYGGIVLPQVEATAANRPTLSYTPIDDSEFTRRLFTPISLEGMAYLGKTTWPLGTVLRLWLQNLNWVPNAESASGPTPREPPEFAQFRAGVEAMQRLRDRGLLTLITEERTEKLTDPVGPTDSTPAAAVEAVKAGFEYRRDGTGWVVVRKRTQPVLRIGNVPAGDADFAAVCAAFKLNPARRAFDLTADKLDPHPPADPPNGLDALDLETRSLLQVLFFVSHGVHVPPADLANGAAPSTDGFDWEPVTDGLFRVCWSAGKKPPLTAWVAVRYRGYWFTIDQADRDTKATFALLVELSRLELGAKAGAAPILTLPLGGR